MNDDHSVENGDIGEEDQQAVSESMLMHRKSFEVESYQEGPLPDPSSLGEYDQVLPGLADRIVNMAEEEAEHRRKTQARIINLSFFRSFAGLIAGLFSHYYLWVLRYGLSRMISI